MKLIFERELECVIIDNCDYRIKKWECIIIIFLVVVQISVFSQKKLLFFRPFLEHHYATKLAPIFLNFSVLPSCLFSLFHSFIIYEIVCEYIKAKTISTTFYLAYYSLSVVFLFSHGNGQKLKTESALRWTIHKMT